MIEQTFSISKAWNVNPPCYVRKVDRRGHWQDSATIQEKVFCPESDNAISVYIVKTASDLARVAIGLNANRSRITEDLFLIAITRDELAQIDIQRSAGKTLCDWANHLHRDLLIANSSQTARLADTLLEAGRNLHKFTKTAMEEALAVATNDGCHAADANSARCACGDEFPAPGSPS